MFLNGTMYGEDRQNGTPLQINDTTIRQLAFGTDYNSSAAGLFTMRLYGGTQNYHQTFSSVALDRDSEFLTDVQDVPVQQMGLTGQWSKQLASRFTLLAGLDGTYVQGVSLETTYSSGKPTAGLSNGGTQELLGPSSKALCRSRPIGRSRWREEKTCGVITTPAPAASR